MCQGVVRWYPHCNICAVEGQSQRLQHHIQWLFRGMEKEAAEILWERSIDNFRIRYTTLLSDGDARTHRSLQPERINPNKERIAKRVCTDLRKLSTESKKRGVTLGGCGKGKLTQPEQKNTSKNPQMRLNSSQNVPRKIRVPGMKKASGQQ